MIIYGSSMSPFVRKTMVFAIEKGIEFELVQAFGPNGPPEFKAASPFGKIPALKDGDFTLADSTAIITYFDALKPEPNLIPTEPKARAKAIWYEEFADTIVGACVGKVFFNRIVAPRFMGRPGDLAAADEAQAVEFPKLADYLESVVPASGYLVEDRITLADLAVASPFANLEHAGCAIDAKTHPKAAAYLAGILARPSFAKIIAAEKQALAAMAKREPA
ncbi:glutathione S-transferase family protein [Phenylobacterium soli]|uniref:Glutathione S-transferase family protein n=1 Tax=Phenylobacterium soli TaxID=2170551 RepID=A0A328AIN2_9CAUL|nr:glutathione S-transferase family protein [Phenylobacterium soli]RAK54640.1 glutathione S-transferase family protein [Phenylobacterium soli]